MKGCHCQLLGSLFTINRTILIIASTPILVILPDNTADAGAGATGCAAESQPCSGNIPAFEPNPIIIKKNTINNKGSCPDIFIGSNTPPGSNYIYINYSFYGFDVSI